MAIPSAVGAALLSSQHICGIVRYTGLFQQRQELLFERLWFGIPPAARSGILCPSAIDAINE
jgi:hypothetical protein